MPNEAPQYRKSRMVVRVTDSERQRIEEAADRALLCPTDFIRGRALAEDVIHGPCKLPHIQPADLMEVFGYLSEKGCVLRSILDQIEAGDLPYKATVENALSRVVWACEEILKALGVVL
jgi:hypothetical protein